jgi:hypothetical protein
MAYFDDDRCQFLRWNGMFLDTPGARKDPHRTEHAYWCHQTQNCMGPDSVVVDQYECNETRKCYQAL